MDVLIHFTNNHLYLIKNLLRNKNVLFITSRSFYQNAKIARAFCASVRHKKT